MRLVLYDEQQSKKYQPSGFFTTFTSIIARNNWLDNIWFFIHELNFAVGKLVAANLANANSLAYALLKNFLAVLT